MFVNTDNTGFEPDGAKFPLFKNSRFEECASLIPDAANCTNITNIMRQAPYPVDREYLNMGYVPISSVGLAMDDLSYDWCTAVSCFNGYTVVPSSARPSVIGLTNFGIWANLNMTAFGFLLTFMKRNYNLYRYDGYKCEATLRKMGIIEWGLVIYTLGGSIVWWWVDFIQFAADPVPNTTVSIFGWAATWLLASNIHYHPYSCALRDRPGLKQFLSWLLALLAVVQWCATLHILNIGWRHALRKGGIYRGYDCLDVEWPGTSQCSADKLCSDPALLANMSFSWDFTERLIVIVSIACFVILSLIAIQPFVFVCWRSFRRGGSWAEWFKGCDIGPIAGPAIAGMFVAMYCGVASYVAIQLLDSVNREAPVVADPNCHAVHVGLSTWRYYLDVGLYAGALRILKSWFNA